MNIPLAFDLTNTRSCINLHSVKSITSVLRYLKQGRIILAKNKERLLLDSDGNLCVCDQNGNFPKTLRTWKHTSWYVTDADWSTSNWHLRPNTNILYIIKETK